MPKKVWNEKELLSKIIELRKKGMSYREIAKNIGCSTFTVSRILSPFENPQSRLKQVVELAEKVDEISKKVEKLNRMLNIVESVGKIAAVLNVTKDRVSKLEDKISELEEKMEIIEMNAKMRVEGDYKCKYIDENGLCTCFDEIDVKKQPLYCLDCPEYRPKI